MQSRYADAVDLYEQALPVYREIGDRLGEAYALRGYGQGLVALNSPGALGVLNDAAHVFNALGRRDRAQEITDFISTLPQPTAR